MKLVGYTGSLRKDSINRRLLAALTARLPEGVTLVEQRYEDVPLYNADVEPPESVARLDAALREADGVIIVTPEFNYGIPGPLKNVLDWLSRPAYKSGWAGRPVTMLGASPGPIGTARAQGQLKQVLLGMAAHVFPFPELTVGTAGAKFDEKGGLADQRTQEQLDRLIREYVAFVGKFG